MQGSIHLPKQAWQQFYENRGPLFKQAQVFRVLVMAYVHGLVNIEDLARDVQKVEDSIARSEVEKKLPERSPNVDSPIATQ